MDAQETISYVCENIGKANYLIVSLLTALGINILLTISRIFVDIMLKNKEKSNHKSNIIAAKSIDVQNKIFQEFYSLSLYDNRQSTELFTKVKEISDEIKRERIYFNKKIFKTSFQIIDYYLGVASDYSRKNYEFENDALELYAKQFNG